MTATYEQYKRDCEKKRIAQQEKLFAYYENDEDKIIKYLNEALNITWNSDDIDEFQKNYINITTKIVDQLSVVYRDPATREILKGKDKNEQLTDYYNNLLFAVNTSDKTAHRFAKLVNTSLTRVLFQEGKIKYKILPSWLYNVYTDDEGNIEAVTYDKYFSDKSEDELYTVVWTDRYHYRIPKLKYKSYEVLGDAEPVPGSLVGINNPYGVNPFIKLTLKEQNDFWGNGLGDLVNTNEQINVLLTDLVNDQIIMGAAGMTLAVNLKLKQKNDKGEWVNQKVRVGRKHPITVEDARTGQDYAPPSLEHVTTNPVIDETLKAIDWQIKMIAVSKGLNPNSFLAEVQATSGFSKIIDSLEQLEIRRDDIEPCRIYEDKRFEITKAVNNYHAGTKDKSKYKLQVIPDDVYLKVDFAEIEIPLTQAEQEKKDRFDLETNKISIVTLAKRDNPDMDDDAIKQMLKNNKEINDQLKQQKINNNPNDGQ